MVMEFCFLGDRNKFSFSCPQSESCREMRVCTSISHMHENYDPQKINHNSLFKNRKKFRKRSTLINYNLIFSLNNKS